MERQPYPPPGSCVAKNSQRPASVETVQGGVPLYGVKETPVVNGKMYPAVYRRIYSTTLTSQTCSAEGGGRFHFIQLLL